MVELRDYQQAAVQAVIRYFRSMQDPAVVVLPTGAGKSLVIAELARLARGRVLVLTHVKELVAQNHAKYQSYGREAGIYAAGLGLKQRSQQVIFASIQSVQRNLADFAAQFSLLVVDECHRVATDADSIYQHTFAQLKAHNPALKILGLTATPYRLGQGFIYQFHYQGAVKGDADCFFRWCIFELPLQTLLHSGYLTPARKLDCAVLSYDFGQIKPGASGYFNTAELNTVINHHKRVTPQIIQQIIERSHKSHGVMIFAATKRHAEEIFGYLPQGQAALIVASTPSLERASIIADFKAQNIKFLVNVSVLTTGFDAPHVDLIAILRPTESISLYQQIVGRGLRLSPGKSECLVLDYAGNQHALDKAEIGPPPTGVDTEQVKVICPLCQYANLFWGKQNSDGFVLEHYGRRCQGMRADDNGAPIPCGYRFRARFCGECGAEHDIAARFCQHCETVLVDPDKKLQDALKLKDCLILYPDRLQATIEPDKDNKPRLRLTYLTQDAQQLTEFYAVATRAQVRKFCQIQAPPMLLDRHLPFDANSTAQLAKLLHRLQPPAVVIGQKKGRFWKIREKLFDLSKNPN